MALVWACERFDVYLRGISFELVTDHKPLEVIYGPKSKLSARIERWVLRLQQYDYKVVYCAGHKNIADALSRLTQSEPLSLKNPAEEYIRFVAEQAALAAISCKEIEQESGQDKELQTIRDAIISDDWSHCTASIKAVRGEITRIGKLVLRNTRIIIPCSLRMRILKLGHEGHQAIVKTKARLRTHVWWPGMDKMIEEMCRSCHECQLVGSPSCPEPMH